MDCRIASTCVALMLMAGCKQAQEQPPGQYELGFKDAYARLLANDFSAFRSDRQCGVLIHIAPTVRTERAIIWQVTSSKIAQFSFTATLTPVDDRHTRVSVAVSPERGSGREAYDGTQFYTRPAVRQPVRPAIEEQIAAILQDRPFDYRRLPLAPKDTVCLVQRGGLEEGIRFSVDDRRSMR